MSVEAVTWAMYDAPMLLTDKGNPDSTARQVLAVLAERASSDGGNAYPSPLRIRYVTGLDERTVQRALGRLEVGGLIKRDGISPAGTVRWRLLMDRRRPDDEWERMRAEADEVRRVESERRKARRHRAADTVSGTQTPGLSGTETPGHSGMSGTGDAGCPGRKVPMSGTQNPDVRDAAPPEPLVQPPDNHQKEPSTSLSPYEPHPPAPVDAETRERDGTDQEEENAYHRLLRLEAGITDRSHADRLIYGADHLLKGGPKGLAWWKKVARQGDLPDVIAEIEDALRGEQPWPASPADQRLAEGAALAAKLDAQSPTEQAHPFRPSPIEGKRECEACGLPRTNWHHYEVSAPSWDVSILDQRYAAQAAQRRRNGRQPYRNAAYTDANHHQPL